MSEDNSEFIELTNSHMDKDSQIIALIDICLPNGECLSLANTIEDITFNGKLYSATTYDITILDDRRGTK